MARTRNLTLLTLAAAGLAVPASAMAAPTTPGLLPFPAFVEGTTPTLVYVPGSFDANNPAVYTVINKRHEISVRDLTTAGAPVIHTVNFPDIPALDLTLSNGHQYAIKARARNVLDFVAPLPNLTVSSDWTAEQVTRVDATGPTGTFEIAGGAQYVNTRDITLTLNGTDPLSAGFTSAGISQYQVTNTASFPCAGSGPSCPKTFAPSVAHQLTDGADGPRTVKVKYRDGARPFFSLFDNTLGNESSVLTDTVLLDRLAPTANAVLSATDVTQGTPVTFDAATSVDGANGPNDSGVDPASYSWQFGDGTSGAGAGQSHTYVAPGTYNGNLTLQDRAGNSATQPFTVTVKAPVTAQPQPPQQPQIQGFSMSPIQVLGKLRANRMGRVRVSLSSAAGIRGTITKKVRGRTIVVRRFTRVGGPGITILSFRAPKAGAYRLTLQANDLSRTRAIRVGR
jgi:PKD repeat protein